MKNRLLKNLVRPVDMGEPAHSHERFGRMCRPINRLSSFLNVTLMIIIPSSFWKLSLDFVKLVLHLNLDCNHYSKCNQVFYEWNWLKMMICVFESVWLLLCDSFRVSAPKTNLFDQSLFVIDPNTHIQSLRQPISKALGFIRLA
jgi:hypothetical protein